MKKFFQELKRRNVLKSALAYLVIAWLITQLITIIIPILELPTALLRIGIIILSLGFPCWIIFSWIYEITSDGLKKTANVNPEATITPQTSNRLNKVIIASLGLAIVFLIYSIISRQQSVSVNQFEDQITTVDTTEKSIAVLAFTDMSPGKDQEFFSDGISEEILNELTKIPDLKVISRTSSFSYKGKGLHIKKIAEELKVNYILEGSVRKPGKTFRITTQLINANTGNHIWSEKYDRNMKDIFKTQNEIAEKVTEQLEVSLLGINLNPQRTNTDAYTNYLRAKQLHTQKSSESNTNAIELIRKSIAIDSTYAPAWAELSFLLFEASSTFLTMPKQQTIPQGKKAAKKAIELDSKNIQGYVGLAVLESASWNFKAANKTINKAIELAPNNPRVLYTASYLATQSGKINLTIEMQLKTITLDPLNEYNYFTIGYYYWMNGQFDQAEENLNRFLLLHPNVGFANSLMGQVQLNLGNTEKAMEYIDKGSHPFWNLYRKNKAVYAQGNTQEANDLLTELITDWGDSTWPNIADVYAFRNEKDEAFKWLELAFENKDSSLLEILNYPAMKNLWGDSRWNKFIDKLQLPEDHAFHLD